MSYGEACFNEGYEQGLDRGRQESKQLRAAARLAYEALDGILSPYGCSLCDCGKSRNPIKGHQPDCPYELARATLAEFYAASSGHLSQDSLMSSLKLWMVGWRDDLKPEARAQMEEIIKYYDKSQGR